MRMRIFKVLAGALLAAALAGGALPLGAQAIAASGTPQTPFTPSTSQEIPLRNGSVDAVTGALRLSFPIGPRLPGRIPLGITLRYDSSKLTLQDPYCVFAPVMWPTIFSNMAVIPVDFDGKEYEFMAVSQPKWLPTPATVIDWLQARGMSTNTSFQTNPKVYPSSDGRAFLLTGMNPEILTYLPGSEH
jgi:hypothetical protein